jgi:hypothetical protein
MATGRIPDANTAPLTAKGDLYTYSTANARLAVGLNGDTLVADSAASTGLRWQSAYNGNAIINGGMDFWQRGTSFTSASVYTADRWFKGSQTGCTVSRQTSGLEGFQYSMRVQRDSGSTNTVGMPMFHNIETQESLKFAGKTVVVSFYAKCGANYSPTSSLLSYILYTGTGTDQARTQSVGFTGEAQAASGTVTLTTSWQRFSFSANIGSTATEICFAPQMNNTGTAGANDWFEIAGVQLELGTVPTTFKRAGGTLQGELAACQRYYVRMWGGGTPAYNSWGAGGISDTTDAFIHVQFPVMMRSVPTLTTTGTASDYRIRANAAFVLTSVPTLFNPGILTTELNLTVSGGGMTVGRAIVLDANNNANAYLAFSAEL